MINLPDEPCRGRGGELLRIDERSHPFIRDKKLLYLVGLGDIHLGKGCDKSLLFKYLQWGRDKGNVIFAGTGDFLQCDLISSKGDVYEQEGPVEQQVNEAERLLRPYRDLFICGVGGNHPKRVRKAVGWNPEKELFRRLEIPFYENEAFISIKFGRDMKYNRKPVVYSIYLNHGDWTNGRKTGSSVNRMEELMEQIDADIFMAGHVHRLHGSVRKKRSVNANGKTVNYRLMRFVNCGTLQRHQPYAKDKGFAPSPLGFGIVLLWGTEKKHRVMI